MKSYTLPLALLVSAATTEAIRLKVRQSRKPSSALRRRGSSSDSLVHPSTKLSNVKSFAATDDGHDGSLDIITNNDLLYIANVTLGGNEYPVQLDTGSSDFWLKGTTSPLPNTTQTAQTYNLTYGIGWVYGAVSYSSMEFADLHVSQQAYLDVTEANNPALQFGALGTLGLGFTSLSTIDALVNGTDSSSGRSVLYNLFAAHPDEPNFIAFALQRSLADGVGTADDVEGSFSIGEYEPEYKAVADEPKISTWPVHAPTRWNVLLESFVVGNQTISVKTIVDDAPTNRAVVLMDSGTTYTYAPPDVCEAIYGNIPGAKLDPKLQQWVVPCDAEVDMALQFNGKMYPVHPLDITPYGLGVYSKVCVGSFVPQTPTVGAGEFDWLIGDNVLRSMYSIYDFGDFDSQGKMGDPYVQLLSLVEPNAASADFAKARGSTPRTGIVYTPTLVPAAPGGHTLTLAADIAELLDSFGMYLPAVVGVVALNTVVLTSLLIVACVLCVRGRSGARPTAVPRSVKGRSRPASLVPPKGMGEHTYAAVSLAVPDETAQPYDPEAARGVPAYGGDARPHSYAPGSRMSQTYPPLDGAFRPPVPAFRRQGSLTGGDRPQSVA